MSAIPQGFVGNAQEVARAYLETIVTYTANEDIGKLSAAEIAILDARGHKFPINPLSKSGIPVYIDNAGSNQLNQDIGCKAVTAATGTTALYGGISAHAAESGADIAVRIAGEAFFFVGSTAIVAGDMAILDVDSTENSSGAWAGDIIPIETVSTAGYGALTSGGTALEALLRLRAMVGIALASGTARVDIDNFQIVRVRLRGY